MTVEQSHLEYFGSQNPKAQMVLNQLKEITGVNDFAVLGQALEASKNASGSYDLDHAINILVDEGATTTQQQTEMADPDPLPEVPESLKNEALSIGNPGVIDLTHDNSEKEDLQKAIALSLKEHQKVLGGQVSMEDQDISRVVEASLAESKAVGTKRKRGEIWLDPINPHDRKRNGDWPVGLKNVGNTCWFSAVIQSLFHLPVFRRLVLQFSPQEYWNSEMAETKERRNLAFMQELRKLFALMLCSKRKYVDPSHALEELKEAFPDSSATENQQDVSEFSHKLLEWLEEAFKHDASQYPVPQNSSVMNEGPQPKRNPVLDLFYGHFKSEGQNEGHRFSNEEAFGQYPLQVNGFNDIHESLDSAMAQEIESCNDGMTKSVQESWFTRLPPVLLFELSRFQFNQHKARPEKIHNKLEFPEIIFMDRYMEHNKEITRTKREQVRRLKDERDKLQNRLEKYLNYGSGPKRVPLQDVLQYTLEFVESKKSTESSLPLSSSSCTEDVEMASPSSASSAGNDSPRNSPHKFTSEMIMPTAPTGMILRSGTNQFPSAMPVLECEPMQEVTTVPSEMKPSPLHVSDVELRVLQSCLRRWRTEVASDVRELQDSINKIDCTIKEIYCEESLQKEPYRLHAVLVHEGHAASGHYWAYVYSPRRQLWLKFNDITVTDASWTELQKDSMGGQQLASAYCLMYVDQCRPDLFEETRESEMTNPDNLEGLPEDLQKYVDQDNYNFLQELEQWDLEQSHKKDSSTMTPYGGGDVECTIVAERKMVIAESMEVPLFNPLARDHASLALKATLSKVDQFNKFAVSHDVESAIEESLKQEVSRLRRIARLPTPLTEDSRLQHIGVYILRNSDSADPYLSLSILEQFTVPSLDQKPGGEIMRQAATQKLEKLHRSLNETYHAKYSWWHEEYAKFRRLVTMFVLGVGAYDEAAFDDALNYFVECCHLNDALITPFNKKFKGLDPKLLTHYRRQSILKLNESVAARFQCQDLKEALEALSDAYEHIVPCMEFLTAADTCTPADISVAEKVRSRWCLMLGEDIGAQKAVKLQDFLAKLLEPGTCFPKRREPACIRFGSLEEHFHSAMTSAVKSGEYAASQKVS